MYKVKLWLLIGGFVLIGSCTSALLVNVIDEPISGSPPLTMEQTTQSIVSAATDLGWEVDLIGEGAAVATLHVRTHMAQLKINFTPEKYSIYYQDSRRLDYVGDEIHRSYNRWIKNLQKKIKLYLNKERQLIHQELRF